MTMKRALAFGVALGTWSILALLLYRAMINAPWLLGSVPQHLRDDVIPTLRPFYQLAIYGGAFLVPLLLVVLWSWLETALRIDPQRISTRSIVWAATIARDRATLLAIVAATIVPILGLIVSEASLAITIPAACVAAIVAFFGVLKPATLGAERFTSWWKPEWPGALPFVAYLLCLIAPSLAAYAWPPLGEITAPLFSVAGVSIVVNRLAPRAAAHRLRRALRWRELGPLIALQAREAYAFLVLLLPTLAITAFLWKHVPVAAAWEAGHHRQLPLAGQLVIAFSHFVADWWWLLFLLPLALFALALYGRLAWLLDQQDMLQSAPS
jgi:hypothetical protein